VVSRPEALTSSAAGATKGGEPPSRRARRSFLDWLDSAGIGLAAAEPGLAEGQGRRGRPPARVLRSVRFVLLVALVLGVIVAAVLAAMSLNPAGSGAKPRPDPITEGSGPGPGFAGRNQGGAALQVQHPADPRRGISGVIRIAPELASRVRPGDPVYVFARTADADGIQLAFIRKRAGELPMTFFLDDSTSIDPARPLSSHGRLVIGARVSRKGKPLADAGDLQGSLVADYGAAGVVIVIDTEVK